MDLRHTFPSEYGCSETTEALGGGKQILLTLSFSTLTSHDSMGRDFKETFFFFTSSFSVE